MQITGNHRYADAFPMASEEELDELAASVAAVGLIHPIVLTPDGQVLDGRNRLEACKRAGIEPTFETRDGDDDDFKEFVIGANTTGRRESMTVQMAAAATALILGHERRKNGRWKRGTINEDLRLSDSNMKKSMEQSGLVLDVLGPPYLEQVRDGDVSLNHVYEQARAERERQENEARAAAEEAAREQREEEHAREVFATDPRAAAWYAEHGDDYDDQATAHRVWLAVDKEARKAEEARRRAEEQRARELHEGDKRGANRLNAFLHGLSQARGMHDNPRRNEILALLETPQRDLFLQVEKEITWPTMMP